MTTIFAISEAYLAHVVMLSRREKGPLRLLRGPLARAFCVRRRRSEPFRAVVQRIPLKALCFPLLISYRGPRSALERGPL